MNYDGKITITDESENKKKYDFKVECNVQANKKNDTNDIKYKGLVQINNIAIRDDKVFIKVKSKINEEVNNVATNIFKLDLKSEYYSIRSTEEFEINNGIKNNVINFIQHNKHSDFKIVFNANEKDGNLSEPKITEISCEL